MLTRDYVVKFGNPAKFAIWQMLTLIHSALPCQMFPACISGA